MKNIVLGKYIPLDSPIHRLDPRAKIIAMVILTIAIFLPAGWWAYAILGAAVIIFTLMAKLSLNFIFRAMKPMMVMMIFLLVVNVIVLKEGTVLFSIGKFSLYSGAITQTLYIVVRLAIMVTITTLLMTTTKPLDLTSGIEDLLKPLKVIKVPAEYIAMMISLALRFIPLLLEESQRIRLAQESRGVDFEEGSLKEKVYAVLSLIVPLFGSALQRAEDLSDAMEVRGFVPGEKRTRYRELHMQKRDVLALLVCTAIFASVVGLTYAL